MPGKTFQFLLTFVLGNCLGIFPAFIIAQTKPSFFELKNRAIDSAVTKNEKAVIRLDIFSRDDRAPKVGTGVVVSPDGLVLTSTFFVNYPKTQIVANINSQKFQANIQGVDHSRQLCLLKIEGIKKLDYLSLKPCECRVGETAIAIGRTLSAKLPNVSVGIVSARNRVWGKAIQTDAKISPVNYGGLLVNLKGEALGLITSIDPAEKREKTGSDWYDSGIGFAIPTADAAISIQKMKNKSDLARGLTGIRFRNGEFDRKIPVVLFCLPRSPAEIAGVLPGDRITKLDGIPIENLRQFKMTIGPRYAGQKILLEIERNQVRRKVFLTLVGKLPVYHFPYLGVIGSTNKTANSFQVDLVDKHGPSHGKLFQGDRIRKINGKAIETEEDFRSSLSKLEAKTEIELSIERNQTVEKFRIQLGDLAVEGLAPDFEITPRTREDEISIKPFRVSGFSNRIQLILPNNYDRTLSGLIVILGETRNDKKAIKHFEFLAKRQNAIVMMVFPESPNGWQIYEIEIIENAIEKFYAEYSLNREAVVCSQGNTIELLAALTLKRRDLIRGWVVLFPGESNEFPIPLSTPGRPLFALLATTPQTSTIARELRQAFGDNGIPLEIAPAATWANQNTREHFLLTWLRLTDRM